ncbi:hypothetical protein [Ureibacillus chungkukjangi]|uniref:Uncharacterized protein n=1 Tax=Ureibacillus chungkukjangi TaxID=1202712 RepID=A0A318TES4_9BACL|nr:hypothetical protein [Ureibacillus chungkukjangi]PYF02327.1 hypothetical protein BJ095_1434 [Ureibacillus chungkukjangi]
MELTYYALVTEDGSYIYEKILENGLIECCNYREPTNASLYYTFNDAKQGYEMIMGLAPSSYKYLFYYQKPIGIQKILVSLGETTILSAGDV